MTSVILCPLRQHPELAVFDDDGLQLFTDVLGIDMYRNWDGSPATTEKDAWFIRQHFDAEHARLAEIDNALSHQAAVEAESRLAPLHRRLEVQQRRQDAIQAIEAEHVPFQDERTRDWEQRADETGAARFIAPEPEVDTRPGIERLKDKESR